MQHRPGQTAGSAARQFRRQRNAQEGPVALAYAWRYEQGVVAELRLDELRRLEAEGVDPVAGAHRLHVLVDGTRPVRRPRRTAADDDDPAGPRQQIAGPEALGRFAKGVGVGDAPSQRAAALDHRGHAVTGRRGLFGRRRWRHPRNGHCNRLSCMPTGHTRMHSKHCATLSL